MVSQGCRSTARGSRAHSRQNVRNRPGVPQDYGQAAEWFRKAADHGYPAAQFNLAYLYGEGRGVPQDRGQALAWYRKAAEQGHTGAQTNLGTAYEAGQGVERDFAQAAAWYRKAADHGNAVAQYNLGNLYGSGRGVPQDYGQAMAWYRKAAAQDHALAGASLGQAYDAGRGVPQDPAQAANWFARPPMTEASMLCTPRPLVPAGSRRAAGYCPGRQVERPGDPAVCGLPEGQREKAVQARKDIESRMTPAQIEQAQKLVREWKPGIQ